jgi:putative hydrolase of the HAD superfamily
MSSVQSITTLFVDIGGVLLSNGWDHNSREEAAKLFNLNSKEMESYHRLTFDTYEIGKLTLKEYLNTTVFYKKRAFTPHQFQKFMFSQSKPFQEMIDLISILKKQYKLKVIAVSNEGRELNAHRIHTFKLNSFIDCFVSSSFVHVKKPDKDIYRIALDLAQAEQKHILYIEDRPLFIQIAKELGIQGLLHTDYKTTCTTLASMGLSLSGSVQQ